MATILLDTNILIDQLRGLPAARTVLAAALDRGDRLVASVLSKVELLAGMLPGEERATRRMIEGLEWIEVDDAIAERAGELGRGFMRSHRAIDIADFVLAATAQLLGAELWTRNVRHFPMFPELEAPY